MTPVTTNFFFFWEESKYSFILLAKRVSTHLISARRLLDIIIQRRESNILLNLAFNYLYVTMGKRWLEVSFINVNLLLSRGEGHFVPPGH